MDSNSSSVFQQLKEEKFFFKKNLGQNFIFDKNLLISMVLDSGITSDDVVIEIGAGAGTLTEQLAKVAKKVISFEIDKNLSSVLSKVEERHENLSIVFKDILKVDLTQFIPPNQKFKVVANLPYYITTPIMFYFLEKSELASITVMVQKEVAERFCANKNSSNYGAVTAQLAYYSTPKITRIVSKKLFNPEPKVDSAIVRLDIEKKSGVENPKTLKKVIAASFAMRRKTLSNNLVAAFSFSKEMSEKILASCNIAVNARGETLDIFDFIKLSNEIENLGNTLIPRIEN